MVCMCGVVELELDDNGFSYCVHCGAQFDGFRSTAVDVDNLYASKEHARASASSRRPEPVAMSKPLFKTKPCSNFWSTLVSDEEDDGVEPSESVESHPRKLIFDDYYTEIRKTYVMGVQIMIELQIKSLVEEFKVCPIIVDMVEPVWLKFVASTNLFSDDWAQNAIEETESQVEGEIKVATSHKAEPCNLLGKRCVMIWYRSLRKMIPLSYALAISFLVCHLAREPILSTDIIKWAVEGKLPYFAAFVEINKLLELPTMTCPLTASCMFRPTHVMSSMQKLESLAASIAQSIGLELPPVKFSAIATRDLKQLSLPVNIILPHACQIYEWSMPPELWLSANEFRLPTHAFVLSILVVSIRILYNIHGFGKWEMSLLCAGKGKDADEHSPCSSQSEVDDSASEPCKKDLDATGILVLLQSKYSELVDASDHAKNLDAYLEYCEKVVFAGVKLSYEEDKITKGLSQFYDQKKKDYKPVESCFLSSSHQRPQDHSQSHTNKTKKPEDHNVQTLLDSMESHREREIRQIKSNMEENKFCYIPPRKRVKRRDYLHYTRKKGDGDRVYVYAAHADYYILLRSCARVAQLDVRSMHTAVLSFERRLGWLEKNIQHSFKLMPCDEDCQHCNLSNELKL